MKKYIRYILKGLAIFFGILVLVYLVAYVYVVAKKKDIIAQIKEQVADKLNGEVQIGNISLGFLAQFPRVRLSFKTFQYATRCITSTSIPFLRQRRWYASISVINLIERINPLNGIQVDNGQLYIYTDTSGYTNSYLLSPKTAADSLRKGPAAKTKVDIESIKFRNVRLVIDDRRKAKLYDFAVQKFNCRINTSDSIITLQTSNNILIHSFSFNTSLGSFAHETPLEGNFTVRFNKTSKQLNFENIDIRLKNHSYNFSGTFNFAGTRTFALKVTTEDVNYDEAKTLLTPVIQQSLSLVKIDKPINNVVANISGPLNGGDPLVNINWIVKKNAITAPFASFTNCSFDGSFTNELVVGLPRKDTRTRGCSFTTSQEILKGWIFNPKISTLII